MFRNGEQFLLHYSDIPCDTVVTTPVINHELGKDRTVITTNGTYPWSFVTQIFLKGHSGDSKSFAVMTLTLGTRHLAALSSLVNSRTMKVIPKTRCPR